MNESKKHKILLLTDIHLRSDYIPGFLENQIKTLVNLANEEHVDAIVINGDIFHKRNPDGDSLIAFNTILDKFKCKNVYVNRGNHDTIHKDGSTSTTLSLFSSKAKILAEAETVNICGVDFDFIPHFEDEAKIIKYLKASKKRKNHVFGHFGFDGCVSNGNYHYEAKVKKHHFQTNRYTFLGHIHKPKSYGNIHVLGTQYSNSFGEANTEKTLSKLIVQDGSVIKLYKTPITQGIRHIVCKLNEVDAYAKKYQFNKFFTILRVKLDRLDEYVERKIYNSISNNHNVDYLELSFEDIIPKFTSDYEPAKQLMTLDDDIISKYVAAKTSVFSEEELLLAYKEITDED